MSKHLAGPTEGTVVSVNISEAKGTIKVCVPRIEITDRGVAEDAHAGDWDRQVSLLGREEIAVFEERAGRPVAAGEFAENLTIEGIDMLGVSVLDQFEVGDVLLKVTQIGKKCHGDACAIFREVGDCIMPKMGLFCRVLKPGTVRPGDTIRHTPRLLRCSIITLSDRASRGEYEDRSGPRIRQRLEEHFDKLRWHLVVDSLVIPDDPDRLDQILQQVRADGTDLVFTTGGTGIGPSDFTPAVVLKHADMEIPGLMNHIRLKYGASNPNALLSRSVAVVIGSTLLFALPGSVRAVSEYTEEILSVLEHMIRMRHGLGH